MAEFHNGEWIFLYILFPVERNAIQPIRKHALNITLDNQKVTYMCSLMKYSVCTRMETRTVLVEARKAVTWMSLVPGSQLGYYGFILSSEYTRRILMNARTLKIR